MNLKHIRCAVMPMLSIASLSSRKRVVPHTHPAAQISFGILMQIIVRMLSALTLLVMVLMLGANAFAQNGAPVEAKANPPDGKRVATTPPKPAHLADGKPNWTGFWVPLDGLLEVYRGPSFLIRNPGEKPAAGSGVRNNPSPLKSPYKERYEGIRQELAQGKIAFDPNALCLPPGMPGMMTMIYGMEFLQTPGQITMTSEWQAASRRVWLDRTTHPDADELDPTYAGDSIGHWEGDTLVVDTIGIRTDVRIDATGLPISEKLRLTERFTQIEPGILQDEITVTDPDVFTTPWKIVKVYRYRPDLRLKEYVCQENNRNVGPNGQPVFR